MVIGCSIDNMNVCWMVMCVELEDFDGLCEVVRLLCSAVIARLLELLG